MNKVATNQKQDCKVPVNLPGYLKYSVTIMPLGDTQDFFDVPNQNWLKKDTLVPEKDITRVFEGFQAELGFPIGPTSFIPAGSEGVKVYFNMKDTNSLVIVAESKKIANSYAENIGLSRKPYSISKSMGRIFFLYL